MKTIIYATTLMALISGCAQNQLPGLRGSLGSQPTIKNFAACDLSVRFSGQPEEMPKDSIRPELNKSGGKQEGQSWMYVSELLGVRKVEVAVCVCQTDFSLPNVVSEVRKTGIYNKYVDGIGYVTESPVIETDNGAKMLTKVSSGTASSCYVLQSVGATGTPESVKEAASPFFSSLAPMPKETQKPAASLTNVPASERLRQLDSLLKEKLISEDEFNKRRAIILDTL